MTNTATCLYSIYKTDYVSRVSKTYRPLRERRNKRQLPPPDSSFKAAKQENRSQGGSDVEINRRALTAHSKHFPETLIYWEDETCKNSFNSCFGGFLKSSFMRGLIVLD